MKRFALIALLCTGCAFEWDIPKVPQHNPETRKMEAKYVYWPPRRPPPPMIIANPTPR